MNDNSTKLLQEAYSGILGEKSPDIISGGKADGKGIRDIMVKYGVSKDEAEAAVLAGTKVEMEHTTDKNKAREIAIDHIYGEHIRYYNELEKMEKKFKK